MNIPREISLETYALCNAACNFCPYPTLERKGEKMSTKLINKLIGEMATYESPFHFSPFKVNEPLLDNRLYDICKAVEERTLAHFRIFTNGSPLTQKKIEQIADIRRVTHLWISLNSTDPEEYERIMRIPWKKTAMRLDNLHAQTFPHPVVLSAVGKDIRSYCRGRWPKFKSFVIKPSSWLGYLPETEVPDAPCSRWHELSIMANGIVSLCCMDGQGDFPIGDVNKQTMLEVYNDPAWAERRERQMSRKDVPVCNTCSY